MEQHRPLSEAIVEARLPIADNQVGESASARPSGRGEDGTDGGCVRPGRDLGLPQVERMKSQDGTALSQEVVQRGAKGSLKAGWRG